MKNTMIHNLVKHLPGLKHIKSEFYRGFVLYTFLISAFLTLGVGQMWGATATTLYYAIPASNLKSGDACYTVKCNVNRKGDGDDWATYTMTLEDNTKDGKLIYKASFTDLYNGLGCIQFQLYNGSDFVNQVQPFGTKTWTSASTYNGKMWVHGGSSWSTKSTDAKITVYFVNTSSWATPKAFAWSGCTNNAAWSGQAMTSTGKTYKGKDIYSISFNKRFENIIFSNNGSPQTSDLTLGSTNAGKMYNNGSWISYAYDHKVIFNANGGSGEMTDQTMPYNTATALKANTFTRDGYRFNGWATTAEGSVAYADGANVTVTSSDLNLYAKWVAEETHDVTVYYKYGSTTIKTETTESAVGVTTPRSITAPSITGYTFSSWTKGSGITIKSGSTSTATISITSGASNNTLTANYAEDLSSTCTLHGGFDDWGSGLAMTKKSGASTSDWVYATVSLTGSTTQTPFKVVDGSNWYGKASTNITKTLGSLTKSITGLTIGGYDETNLYLQHLVTGSYEIGYNMSTHEFKVTWPDVNQIQITSGDASSPTPAGYYNFDGVSGTVYSKTFTFSKNKRYSAKIIYHSDFYAFNNTSDMTISNHTSWRLYDTANGANICNVYSPVAGSYTYQFNSNDGGKTTLTVVYPTAYTITYGVGNLNGSNSAIGATATPSFSNGDYVLRSTAVTFTKGATKAGYAWKGWYSNADGTGTLHSSTNGSWTSAASTRTGNISVYACYTLKTYTATLSTTGKTGYGSGAPANQTVTYTRAMPTITPPTAADGYCFMGYWDGAEGTGTKYYNANGTSAHAWDKTSSTTLHAYFKKAEIVDLSIEPSLAEKGGTVKVTPEIEPTPAGTTSVCYYLLYMNGNKVDPQPDFGNPNSSGLVSFTAPNVAGTFILAAALRTGSSCGGGTLLDSVATHTFQVGGEYNVTVKYMRDNVAIKPQTKVAANPSAWTEITAPDIIGYSFSKWKAGDGVTIEGAASGESTSATIRFQATYDGTLTALYTKRNIIYFNNTYTQWSDVYVYFYNSGKYWAEGYGTGAYKGKYFDGDKPYWETEHGHMTRIEGTNIWYFDYTEAGYSTRSVVAFANMDKSNSGTDNTSDNSKAYFANTTTPIQVARRSDHNANLPMFVPIAQTGVKLNSNKANYTSEGYWMNYPENTGYSIRLFNQITGVGTYEVDSIPVEFTEDYTLAETINVLMDAGHTYGFKLFRADNVWMGNTGTMTNGASGDVGQTAWEFRQKNDDSSDKPNCGLTTTAAGTYTFSVSYGKKGSSYDYLVGVHYPVVAGDFQILYKDTTTWSNGKHSGTWSHPSRIIEARANGVDTISFFVAKGKQPQLKARKVNSIAANTGVITWGSLNIGGSSSKDINSLVSESGVYNFKVTQGNAGVISSIENIGAYTGNYYIRCNAMNNKWGNFRDDHDHLMTYSAFSEDRSQNGFGDLFSHYKAKWCPRSTNVKFCIANDYSLCISDTLIRDITKSWPENMDATGTLYSEGGISDVTADKWSANIRFMWNRKTNKISRAYVASATNTTRKFLVLRGCDTKIHDHNNNVIPATDYLGENEILLEDDQNWIYETTIKAKPTARVKLYACYGEKPANVVNAQYFRGAYDSNNCGSNANSIQILGGSGSNYYLMRVIYDFKTNRLITAWLPDGTPVDQAPLNIDADVMVIRDHQQAAEAITFTNSTKSLGNVKTVYGTIRFNRWTLNNRYRMSDTNNPLDPSKWSTTETDINKDHCNTTAAISRYHAPLPPHLQTSSFERNNYFISFPFDVQLSEVFGFGTYGTHWIISKYNGLRRAQVGYFRDNCINGDFDCTNWDYIWDRTGVTLKAYEGYLLSLDLDLMQYDDTTNFWLNQIHQVELYFPSKVPMSTITTTNVTLPGMTDDYLCTKNYNKDGTNPEGDRRVKDSYWRCIGVPSYAPYGTVLKTGETEIQWNTDYTWYEDQRSFPFLYEWNTTDNTLTPQRTKTFNFKPLHSYLVQNKNTITWTAVSATPSSIVRRQRTEAQQEYTWRLNLTGDDNDESDTYIRMTDDEEVTEGFDFGPDMIKKLRDGYIVDANGDPIWDSSIDDYKQGVLHSDIYSILGYEYLAANSIPLNTTSTTIIPIGVRLKKAGEFTLSMPDGTYGVSITLVDNNTGARTELGAGFTYSFESEVGQFDDRFYLEIAKIKDVATGTEEIGEPSKSDVRKVMIDGILYIVRSDQIFDALGNRVE